MERVTNPERPRIEPGVYEHYKGGLYEVLKLPDVALHTEEDEWLVVYRRYPRCDEDDEFFARPHDMFVGTVRINSEDVPRFQRVDKE